MRRPGRRSGHGVRGRDAHPSSLRRASLAPARGGWPAAQARARRTPSTRWRQLPTNTRTRQSGVGAARLNRITNWAISGGSVVITTWSATSRNNHETTRPHAAAASARRRLSVSSCRMMRRRDAPSDSRMPISRWRETPRASSRLATLAQPMARISPKAKNRGEKTRANPSLDSVPWRGVSETWIGRPAARRRIGSSRCPPREGGCRGLGRQPRFQPPDDLNGDLVFSSCIWSRNCPASASGAQ